MKRIPFAYFAPDVPGGSPAAPQAGTPGGDPAATVETPGGSGTPENPAVTPVVADEQDPAKRLEALEKELKSVRNEAAGYRTKLKKQEETALEAETAKLKEQEQWKVLAERNEARVKELEPLQVKLTAYEARETARVAESIKDWPENLKALVEKASTLEEKQAVLDSLKPTVDALANKPVVPGTGPGPKPASPATDKITPSRPVRL